MATVMLYVTGYCPYCHAVVSFFEQHGVPFEKVDVTNDPDARMMLVERTGQRTVPQVFIGEKSVGGYTDVVALHRRGDLYPMLDELEITHN